MKNMRFLFLLAAFSTTYAATCGVGGSTVGDCTETDVAVSGRTAPTTVADGNGIFCCKPTAAYKILTATGGTAAKPVVTTITDAAGSAVPSTTTPGCLATHQGEGHTFAYGKIDACLHVTGGTRAGAASTPNNGDLWTDLNNYGSATWVADVAGTACVGAGCAGTTDHACQRSNNGGAGTNTQCVFQQTSQGCVTRAATTDACTWTEKNAGTGTCAQRCIGSTACVAASTEDACYAVNGAVTGSCTWGWYATAATWTKNVVGTTTGATQATPAQTYPLVQCDTKCILGYTNNDVSSGETNQPDTVCRPCSSTIYAGVETFVDGSVLDNCKSTATGCKVGYYYNDDTNAGTGTNTSCDACTATGGTTTNPVGGWNGFTTWNVGMFATMSTKPVTDACDKTCSVARGFYLHSNGLKQACEQNTVVTTGGSKVGTQLAVANHLLVWVPAVTAVGAGSGCAGTETVVTGAAGYLEFQDTTAAGGSLGFLTFIPHATDKTKGTVTCSVGYCADNTTSATDPDCVAQTDWGTTATNNKVWAGCGGGILATSATWTCSPGFDGGTSGADANHRATCTARTAKFTWTDTTTAADTGAQTQGTVGTTEGYGGISCTTAGTFIQNAKYGDFTQTAGATAGLAWVTGTIGGTAGFTVAEAADAATPFLNLGTCAAATLTAQQFVTLTAGTASVHVCGEGRNRGSNYSSMTATAVANYDMDQDAGCTATAPTGVVGSRTRLAHTYKWDEVGTFDDSMIFECDWENWSFKQAMVAADATCNDSATALDGKATDATCVSGKMKVDGPLEFCVASKSTCCRNGCATTGTAQTAVAGDNSVTFSGKCAYSRNYYLNWATGACGMKRNQWTRDAGATNAACKWNATKWVMDRAVLAQNAAGTDTNTSNWTSWKSTTADAGKCPANNAWGGLCSHSTNNYDKTTKLSNVWGATTTEECTSVGTGAESDKAWTGADQAADALLCDTYWNAFETNLHSECDRQKAHWDTVTAFEALTGVVTTAYQNEGVYTTLGAAANWSKIATVLKQQTTSTATPPVTTYDFRDTNENTTATPAVAAQWNPAQYNSRDAVPAFVALAWSVKNAKTTTNVYNGFKKVHCTAVAPATTPATYTCSTEQAADITKIVTALCATAGRTFSTTASGTTGCDDAAQPSAGPSGTPGTSTSPANVAYSFFALIVAAVFAL